MTGLSHLIVGAAFGVLVSKNPLAGSLFGGLGGVIVDIDADNSWLQVFLSRKSKPVWTNTWLGRKYRGDLILNTLASFISALEIATRELLTALIDLLKIFVDHRGIIHTLLSAFVISGVITILNFGFGIAFLAGYLSHLVLDGMTKSGTTLLNPFYKKAIYFLPPKFRIKTGDISEFFIVFAFVLICCLIKGLI